MVYVMVGPEVPLTGEAMPVPLMEAEVIETGEEAPVPPPLIVVPEELPYGAGAINDVVEVVLLELVEVLEAEVEVVEVVEVVDEVDVEVEVAVVDVEVVMVAEVVVPGVTAHEQADEILDGLPLHFET